MYKKLIVLVLVLTFYIGDGSIPSSPIITVEDDVVSLSVMPDGRIILVQEVTICRDTIVYGSPSYDGIQREKLMMGDKVYTHEIWHDWVMFSSAKWIPIDSICGLESLK